MAFEPEQPFPKGKGDSIRSKDWNDAIEELQGKELQGKVDRAGDTIDGDLIVTGTIHADSFDPLPAAALEGTELDVGTRDGMVINGALTVKEDLTVEGTIHGTLADDSVAEPQLHPEARSKLVTGGEDHAHADGDGATVKHSDLELDGGRNPHETRHSDLQLDGGRNPHGTTADDVGAVGRSGTTLDGRLRLEHEDGSRVNVFGRAGFGARTTLHVAPDDGRVGLWVDSSGDSAALSVVGESTLIGDVNVLGDMWVQGTKHGCVTDIFINRSGATLRPGDVVRLNAAGTMRFHGVRNVLPVAEVALAEHDGDGRVIGVVGGSAPAFEDPPSAHPREDRTTVPDGADVSVVTLGAFASCKVDASYGAIEVGDLLTTSANAGHARKADDPRLGTVLGQALEPLEEGTGYIAVFITIQ